MRFFVFVLCLVPLVFALPHPEPRGFGDEIKKLAEKLLHSGVTETACDTGCHAIASVLGFLCNPACGELQKLLNG